MSETICVESTCDRAGSYARKMCRSHYESWLRRNRDTARIVTCARCGSDQRCAPRGRLPALCEECQRSHAWCPVCASAKPRARFSKSRGTRSGLYGVCKSCHLDRIKLRLYGVDAEERAAMDRRQRSRCAICRDPLAEVDANIDHCHSTGRVRGLLCGPCNRGLGCFLDDRKRLAAAIEYLEAFDRGSDDGAEASQDRVA